MTAAEYQAGIERLAKARAALQEYEDLALGLASDISTGYPRSLLLCVKEQMHATRMLVMEAVERCKREAAPAVKVGWGG